MSRRPIAVIASRLFAPEVGAGAFRLTAMGTALVRAGFDVSVLTTRPPKQAPSTPDPDGIRVRRWPVLRDGGGNVRGYVQYASYDGPLILRMLFARYDVAVAESPPTTGIAVGLASILRRKKFIYYAADVWTDGVISMGAARPIIAIMRAMERWALRRATRIISVSDGVTERLVTLGADPARVVTVGNGVDTQIFNPDAGVASPGERYFVYTGTMSEWQQPDVFVRAFARVASQHPDISLRFFGQGVVEADLRALADELIPGRVHFGGVVSPAESASWIRGALGSLVSIVPGIGYDFARPTKTYAAAAVGTPVIFAGPDGGATLVREGDLGLAVAFSETAVADAMRRLITEADDGTSERLRPERVAWANENVSSSAVAHRVAGAVSEVLAESGGRLGSGASVAR
ncbi:glycosyltransferase family 4 protein [Microbacterium gorillae]|uniref:glycosyltransferase family 4 protein n=1 Tax=Microbacterium gorillae TaxID=1231063 RepID=UPI0018A8603B|nr:glycosyltransferase family 4 protein [Microbacterium gorillae]